MKKILLTFSFLWASISHCLPYAVQFEGLEDKEAKELITQMCDPEKETIHTAPTMGALHRKAESDQEKILDVYKGLSFYNAKVSFAIDTKKKPASMSFTIEEGETYPLIQVTAKPKEQEGVDPIFAETLEEGIQKLVLPQRATSFNILTLEEELVSHLVGKGYPFTHICERRVIVDQKEKSVSVTWKLEGGKLVTFGKAEFVGNQKISPNFLQSKILWKEGDIYTPEKVENTVKQLEKTGLFSSVSITPTEEALLDREAMPVMISLQESPHRSLGFGFSYNTREGWGANAEWEHRNFWHMGRKLTLGLSTWENRLSASVQYLIPDLYRPKQDLILRAVYDHESGVPPCRKLGTDLSAILDQQISPTVRGSAGITLKLFKETKNVEKLEPSSEENKSSEIKKKVSSYSICKFPLNLSINLTDNPLDPKEGSSAILKVTPSLQVSKNTSEYVIAEGSYSLYSSPKEMWPEITFATQLSLGSLVGVNLDKLPKSELFFKGSGGSLRGYTFRTVSPIDKKTREFVGGKSYATLSLEARLKASEQLGGVLFYDIGNVHEETFPSIYRKQLQSVGFGIRYYTAIAPIRLDCAFPLNPRSPRERDKEGQPLYDTQGKIKRKQLDNPYRVYLSVGQTF